VLSGTTSGDVEGRTAGDAVLADADRRAAFTERAGDTGASMLATAGLLLVQVRPLVSGRLEPLARMPVAAKAWLWPVRIRG
jgi:hypothetical protein